MSMAASELVAQKVHEAAKTGGRASIVLSGGETPQRAYEFLAHVHAHDRYFWKNVHVFWGDERCVPADDSRSNQGMARRSLLDHISIPDDQIHPMQCGDSPLDNALNYESLLRNFFADSPPVFDVVLLGLGEDGHTASIFPGSKALGEKERWVVETHKIGENFHRITLTLPLINQAAMVIFLVAGRSKAHILHEVLYESPGQYQYPARYVRPVGGQLIWLVDQEASYVLKNEPLTA
jgi:6-phosphogluconolactonase